MLINNLTSPLKYDVDTERAMNGNLAGENTKIIIVGISIIFSIIVVYFICRFKQNGIIAGVSMVMTASLLSLIIRYANIDITLNAFGRIFSAYACRCLFDK